MPLALALVYRLDITFYCVRCTRLPGETIVVTDATTVEYRVAALMPA